jgi:hypothetical protein
MPYRELLHWLAKQRTKYANILRRKEKPQPIEPASSLMADDDWEVL